MPINLPPQAMKAERRYRDAQTPEEKIATLQEYLSLIPKHKGTDHLRANLRRKLSKLKSAAQAQKKLGRQVSPYHVDRQGAGQVVLVGAPNVGKSSLVVALTNATPEVSEAPYTTWGPTPGMMLAGNVQIQLIDTLPLSEEYVDPEFIDLVRRCDLVLVVVDLQTFPIKQLEDTLALLERHRIVPQRPGNRYPDDVRLSVKPLLVVVNRTDDERFDDDFDVLCELLEDDWPLIPVSATTGRNLERLRAAVFDELQMIRIYAKAPGQEPDRSSPFVMRRGGTAEELARKIHKDFVHNLKAARVWGVGVHDGQMVGRDHVLHDEDVVELRT